MKDPGGAFSLASLEADGYILLTVFSPAEIAAIRKEVDGALAQGSDGSALRAGGGSIYGARNVLQLWPNAATIWKRPPLTDLLLAVLGPRFGLVRVLFFDKPPDQTWALPWHRDLTIAVKNNRLPSQHFRKPTRKGGVLHIQAPPDILANMLTVRLHLDEVTAENGPLCVVPGSHRDSPDSPAAERPAATILAAPGEALAMRPLLLHSSNCSHPGTHRHRRILHLEFAATPELPDGYAWHEFIGGGGPSGTIYPSAIP